MGAGFSRQPGQSTQRLVEWTKRRATQTVMRPAVVKLAVMSSVDGRSAHTCCRESAARMYRGERGFAAAAEVLAVQLHFRSFWVQPFRGDEISSLPRRTVARSVQLGSVGRATDRVTPPQTEPKR